MNGMGVGVGLLSYGSAFLVLGASWVAHASSPLMAVVDRHKHGGRDRSGAVGRDSSLAVLWEVRCEGERAPWRR